MDDLELLLDYANHKSEAAFAALVNRHVDLVYSVSLRFLRDAQLAEEVAQAVFLVLARKATKIPSGTVLAGWLYKTARYTAGHALRAKRRRERHEELAAAAMKVSMDSQQTSDDLGPLLDEALATLANQDRSAILLRFFEQKPFKEVGCALGVSEEAAKKRIARALEKLRASFAKGKIVYPSGAIAAALSAYSIKAAPAALAPAIVANVTANTAIAASTATLAQQTLDAMAWTKMKTAAAAGLMVAASIATATYSFRTITKTIPEPVRTDTTVVVAAPQPLNNAAATTALLPLNWREIESPDCRLYMENLRRIGVPGDVVHAIVADKINRDFAPRIAALMPPRDYWGYQHAGDVNNIARSEQRRAVLRERRKAFYQLGLTLPEDEPDYILLANPAHSRLDFLPLEKRHQVADLLAKFDDLGQNKWWQNRDLLVADELDQQNISTQRRAEIAALLTQDELEQLDIRTSKLADRLRYELRDFNPTESEFQRIFRVLKTVDDEFEGSLISLAPTTVPRERKMEAAKEQLDTMLQEQLGQERFHQYERARDPGYRGLQTLAGRFDLSTDAVETIYSVQTRAQEQQKVLRKDLSLSEAQRKEKWIQLQRELVEQLRGAMDQKAFDTYQSSRLGQWAAPEPR